MHHSPKYGNRSAPGWVNMISEAFFSLLAAALISFIGSLQPGPVNLMVLGVASGKRYGQALLVALGGSLPEAFFVFVAIRCSAFIEARAQLLHLLSGIVSVLFVVCGIWLIFAKQRQPVYERIAHRNGFITGFILACSNPQLVFFWVAILTLPGSYQHALSSAPVQYGFMAGAAVGAFSLHFLLLLVTRHYAESIFFSLYRIYVNKVTGAVLLLAGVTGALMLI